MEMNSIVEFNQANKRQRFVNYFFDLIIFIATVDFFKDIVAVFLHTEVMPTNSDLFWNITVIILLFLYYFVVESVTKGKTVGKLITGTKVVTEEGEIPTANQFLIRTLTRFVPFEPLSFFGEINWHDKWSHTRVIKIKDFENDLQNQLDISKIGEKEA
ncbi:MAG: RDD family protein [Flavobacteriaceae bacterium]|jgi:uncharacterized RDD family membrane protein YckC|nr:RDD family protein [Flavobacteriaceae bacterium]